MWTKLFFLFIISPILLANPIEKVDNDGNKNVQEVLDEEKLTILSRKPAMKLKMTKTGMDYLHMKAIESFNDKLVGSMKFEEKTLEKDNMTVVLQNTTVTSFTPAKFAYTLLPGGNMIMCQGLGGSMTMEGEFDMKTTDETDTLQMMRPFAVTMDGFNFTMVMMMGMKNGKPTMHMESCSVNMTSIHVEFNCTDKMCDETKDEMMQLAKVVMNATVCQIMYKGVTKINFVMQSFKTSMPVGMSPYHVEYSMLGSPKCQLDACETMHTAEVTTNDTDVPLLPAPLPAVTFNDDKSMMTMQISDYMMNSFAESLFRSGMMNMTICNETATPDMAAMLRTSCSKKETCLGRVSKDFDEKLWNSSIRLQIRAVKPMFFETKSWGMRVYTQSVMTVLCDDDVELMRMEMTGRAEITSEVVGCTMHMNATLTHTKVTIVKSQLDDVDVAKVEELAAFGLFTEKPFFTEIFDHHLAYGIPLPQMDGVQMINPRMVMDDRAMTIFFDISF